MGKFNAINDFEMLNNIALGRVNGASLIRKFGENPDVDTASNEIDIWEFGSGSAPGQVLNYKYPADGTAPIDTISSSDNGDTQLMVVEGLDIDGNFVSQEITLTGQTKAVLSTPLWRGFVVKNIDASTGANRAEGLAGVVYLYEDTAIVAGVPTDKTTVRAIVNNGNNQTLMSQYCVPNGFTGLIIGVEISISKKGTAAIDGAIYQRDFGKPFRKIETYGLSSAGTSAVDILKKPILVSERTDLVVTTATDTNNIGVNSSMHIVLFENEVWGL